MMMDRYFRFRRGIWLCTLALTVLAVLTAPLAVSRYTAQGQGSARARIAAWDVAAASSIAANLETDNIFTAAGNLSAGTVALTNDSEVMADITLSVKYVSIVNGSAGTVTAASPNDPNFLFSFTNTAQCTVQSGNNTSVIKIRMAPASSATVNAAITYSSLGMFYHKCSYFIDAVQVD